MKDDIRNYGGINILATKAKNVPAYVLAAEFNILCSFIQNDSKSYFTGDIPTPLIDCVFEKSENYFYALMYSIGEELYGDKKFLAIKARKEGFDLLEALHELFNKLEESDRNKETEEMLRNNFIDMRLAFIEYVNSFDETKYEIDPWGVLNPPGVDVEDDE